MTSNMSGPATFLNQVCASLDGESMRTDMALKRGGLGEVAFHRLVAAVPLLNGGKTVVMY